jgi:plastocyanin
MTETKRSRRDVLCRGAVVLSGASIAGCTRGASSEPRIVSMTNRNGFDPRTVTIDAGRTVRWTNDSDVGHTVTAYETGIPDDATYFASGGFESERAARNDVSGGIVPVDEGYEHSFERSGIYEYFCIPHEGSGMVGTVRVR